MSGGDARTPLQVFTPGWRRLRDLWTPPPQNKSVTFQEVEPPLWCQADWEAGLGVGRGAAWFVTGRGRHSQPEANTSKSDTDSCKCAKEQEEMAVWRGTGEENGGVRAPHLGPRVC